MAAVFFIFLAAYLGCGLVFAVIFSLRGVSRIDPHATHGSWGFRVLILPGAAALWPWLLHSWRNGKTEPKEQRDPHRSAVQKEPK